MYSNSSVEYAQLYFPSRTTVYINASVSTLLTIVAIPGNFAMILVFLRVKELRDLNNMAITFLSSSDFLRACVIIPLKIYNQINFVQTLVEPTCTITAIVCAFTFVFSPMTLALIGVVRYCNIVPWTKRSFKLSEKRFYCMIAVLLFLATAFSLLPVIGITGTYIYSPSHGVCFTEWIHENEIFRTLFYILVIGLAFPVLTMCYFLLFRALRRNNKDITEVVWRGLEFKLREKSNLGNKDKDMEHNDVIQNKNALHVEKGVSSNEVAVIATNTNNHSENQTMRNKRTWKEAFSRSSDPIDNIKKTPLRDRFSTNTSNVIKQTPLRDRFSTSTSKVSNVSQERLCKHISKQEHRVTRLMMIIFIAYCLCWFPAAIINAMALYHKQRTKEKIPPICFYLVTTMVDLKCAINPLIYGLGNRNYRKALRDIVKRFDFGKKYDIPYRT